MPLLEVKHSNDTNVHHHIDCGIRQHNIWQRSSSSLVFAELLQVANNMTV